MVSRLHWQRSHRIPKVATRPSELGRCGCVARTRKHAINFLFASKLSAVDKPIGIAGRRNSFSSAAFRLASCRSDVSLWYTRVDSRLGERQTDRWQRGIWVVATRIAPWSMTNEIRTGERFAGCWMLWRFTAWCWMTRHWRLGSIVSVKERCRQTRTRSGWPDLAIFPQPRACFSASAKTCPPGDRWLYEPSRGPAESLALVG